MREKESQHGKRRTPGLVKAYKLDKGVLDGGPGSREKRRLEHKASNLSVGVLIPQ